MMKMAASEKLVVTKKDVRDMLRACAQAKGLEYRPTTLYSINDSLYVRCERIGQKLGLSEWRGADAIVDYQFAVAHVVAKIAGKTGHRATQDTVSSVLLQLDPMLEVNYERRRLIKDRDEKRILIADAALSLVAFGLAALIYHLSAIHSPSKENDVFVAWALPSMASISILSLVLAKTIQRIRDSFGKEARRTQEMQEKIQETINGVLEEDC